MFGYIAINKAEMKFKDYDMYHSYYCGLCKRLKENYGRSGQLTLSYDMTFLIVLLTGLYEPETSTDTTNCIAHPFEKHTTRTNEITDYAAAVNLILSYYKSRDDWDDERKKRGLPPLRFSRAISGRSGNNIRKRSLSYRKIWQSFLSLKKRTSRISTGWRDCSVESWRSYSLTARMSGNCLLERLDFSSGNSSI